MGIFSKVSLGLVGLALVIVMITYGTYSSIVTNDEAVNESWGNVESTYQRRADLIPNLVKVVNRYATHEKKTLEGVINARARATQTTIDAGNITPEKIAAFQAAQGGLSSALGKLMVVVEKYPNLKANEEFLKLQDQLEGTENRINVARRDYNKTVRQLNVSIRTPIGAWVNNHFTHVESRVSFTAQKGSDVAPEVHFGN